MMNREINNNSDVEIAVEFTDDAGNSVGVPSFDFELEYFVYPEKVATAYQKDGILSPNCHIVDGVLHVYFDKPKFGEGRLRSRKWLHIPNENFPDGVRDICIETPTIYTIV